MTDETTGTPKRTMRQRVERANPIHAAIVGAIVTYVSTTGISGIVDRIWPPIVPIVQNIAVETAKQNERLDRLQQSVDKLWQIKVEKHGQAQGP